MTVSGNISAGSSATTVGTLTTGSQTWNAGGGYVANFANTATGDKLIMSGLTVSATNAPGGQFLVTPQNVALVSGTSFVIATDTNTSTGTVDPLQHRPDDWRPDPCAGDERFARDRRHAGAFLGPGRRRV